MPSTIEMIINRRTAAALRLSLPSNIALRADREVD